jgi:hypothetical protein
MLIPKFKAMRSSGKRLRLCPGAKRRQCEALSAAAQYQSRATMVFGDTVKIATNSLQWRAWHKPRNDVAGSWLGNDKSGSDFSGA